jgi:hypothetical protein
MQAEIAMNDAVRMRVGELVANVEHDIHGIDDAERSVIT